MNEDINPLSSLSSHLLGSADGTQKRKRDEEAPSCDVDIYDFSFDDDEIELYHGGYASAGDVADPYEAFVRPLSFEDQHRAQACWDCDEHSDRIICSVRAGIGGSSVEILKKHMWR